MRVAILLLLCGVALATQGPDTLTARRERDADRWLAAFRAGDEPALTAFLERPEGGLFLVADVLFARHAARSVRKPEEPGAFLAAAESLARRAQGRPPTEGLLPLVQAWKALDASALAREVRVRARLARAVAGNDAREWGTVIEVAGAPDLLDGATGTAGVLLRFELATALRGKLRFDEAARVFREVARLARELRWPEARWEALEGAVLCDRDRGDFRETPATLEEQLTLCDPLGRSRGTILDMSGNAHFNLGQRQRALELHLEALREVEASGPRDARGRVLMNLGIDCCGLGQHGRGIAYFERALQEAEAGRGQTTPAVVLTNLGAAYTALGEHGRALEALARARQGFEKAGDRAALARVLVQLGLVYLNGERLSEALAVSERARVEKLAVADRLGAARALANQGVAHLKLGQYGPALERLEQALREFEALGNPEGMALTLSNLAGVYGDLGREDRELELHEKALRAKETLGDRASLAVSLMNLGFVHGKRGRPREAIRFLEKALREAEASGSPQRAQALQLLGLCHGDLEAFETAEVFHKQALRAAQELGDRAGVARCLQGLAFNHEKQGEHARALELHQRAARETAALGNPFLTAECHLTIAHGHLRLGEPEAALEEARQAVELRRRIEHGLGEEEATGLVGRWRDAAEVGVLASLALASRSPGEAERGLSTALWFVESGRARLLAERLLHREAFLASQLPAELAGARVAARARVRDAQARLGRGSADPAEARRELDAAYRALEEAGTRMEREARRATQVIRSRPPELADLRQTLPEQARFLLYHVNSEKVIVLVLGRETGTVVDLGPPAALLDRVERYLRLVSTRNDDRATVQALEEEERRQAAELYDALLGPFERHLRGSAHLVVSPDDLLSLLPFEVLLRRDGEVRERVLERWAVSYVPSATVHGILHQEARDLPRGEGLLAVGDPVFRVGVDQARDLRLRGLESLRPLPESGREVRAIAALFPDPGRRVLERERATIRGLVGELEKTEGRLAALHLACHGHVDTAHPRLTGLVLTGGDVLALDDVYRLRVLADLVVLSACDSGRGDHRRGEGMIGLVRGFFYAGAPRVVASDWLVDDDSTRALMVAFYSGMFRRGLAPGAALRAAKLELLRAGGPTSHPYHWAPFVLWGLWE
jgi:CHAT domain-containing protein/Tfp pilus assembly protein PilF